MLRIQGPEIEMEGSFGDMITEVARLMHAIAKEATTKFEEETDGEVNYDHVVELILDELSKMKRFDENPDDIPQEILDEFLKEAVETRKEGNHSGSFIDYYTGKPDENTGRSIIQSVIKDVFNDTRSGELDIDDLKAIKASNKKRKKD